MTTIYLFESKLNLCLNKYGNLLATAEGKVRDPTRRESAVLFAGHAEHVRKILRLKPFEWAALSDVVEAKELHLHYDACKEYDMSKLSPVESLWVVTCGRRHSLPAVIVEYSIEGAVRDFEEFDVLPKLVIDKVYDVDGKELE